MKVKMKFPRMYTFKSNAFVMPKGTIASSIRLVVIYNDRNSFPVDLGQSIKEFKYNKFTRLLTVDGYKNLKENEQYFVICRAIVKGKKLVTKREDYKKSFINSDILAESVVNNENSIH